MGLINAFLAKKRSTGTGIVAIIDTGVDPRHPLLSPVLVTGYDFTRNVEGAASEWNDLNQSTAAILQRSEEHTSELQSRPHLVCRLLLEKKKQLQIGSLIETIYHDTARL